MSWFVNLCNPCCPIVLTAYFFVTLFNQKQKQVFDKKNDIYTYTSLWPKIYKFDSILKKEKKQQISYNNINLNIYNKLTERIESICTFNYWKNKRNATEPQQRTVVQYSGTFPTFLQIVRTDDATTFRPATKTTFVKKHRWFRTRNHLFYLLI